MLIKVDYSFHLFVARRILIQHWLVLLEQIIYYVSTFLLWNCSLSVYQQPQYFINSFSFDFN